MPLYTFHCDSCHEKLELFLSARELREGVNCPNCKSTDPMSQVNEGQAAAKGGQASCSLGSKKS